MRICLALVQVMYFYAIIYSTTKEIRGCSNPRDLYLYFEVFGRFYIQNQTEEI